MLVTLPGQPSKGEALLDLNRPDRPVASSRRRIETSYPDEGIAGRVLTLLPDLSAWIVSKKFWDVQFL